VRTIFYTLGVCLVGLGFFLVFPALLETTLQTQDWTVFALASFVCLFFGVNLMLTNKSDEYNLTTRQTYLLTTLLWVVIPIFSGLPFYFTSTSYHLNFTDAVFEAVSGMTTTGSTVYANLDNAPRGILLWRSMTQWLGGMGIIVLTMIILPYLRVGGMQLFRTESSDRSDKILPRTHDVAIVTVASYITLSTICAIVYYMCGMTEFDAINHAMTTLATGGYSTHDASFGHFTSPLLQWMGTLFMMLGGTPMLLYYTFLTNRVANRQLLYQTKVLWIEVAVVLLIMTLYVYNTSDKGLEDSFRLSGFNMVSGATTAG
jgi:trk system potassium uptake protein TrkH